MKILMNLFSGVTSGTTMTFYINSPNVLPRWKPCLNVILSWLGVLEYTLSISKPATTGWIEAIGELLKKESVMKDSKEERKILKIISSCPVPSLPKYPRRIDEEHNSWLSWKHTNIESDHHIYLDWDNLTCANLKVICRQKSKSILNQG